MLQTILKSKHILYLELRKTIFCFHSINFSIDHKLQTLKKQNNEQNQLYKQGNYSETVTHKINV